MFRPKIRIEVAFFILLGFILFMSACSRPKGVLSQSKMADVLVDMHKADAALVEKNLVYVRYSMKAPYYNFILKKHDITQAQFDSSLVWYTKNPQQFENVYTDVIDQLTKLQKDVNENKFHPIDPEEIGKIRIDLWNKDRKFAFNKDSTRTKLDFEIQNNDFLYKDMYVLKFLLKISPDDSCTNQRIELRLNYFNGKSDHTFKCAYNDGITRRYTFRVPAFRKWKIKSISGQLLASSGYKGVFQSTVDSISLMREFKPQYTDSLRRIVQKADPKAYPGAIPYIFPPENVNGKFKKGRIIKPE